MYNFIHHSVALRVVRCAPIQIYTGCQICRTLFSGSNSTRRGRDSNPRSRCQDNCLAGSPIQPLSHLSIMEFIFKTICRGGESNPYSLSATSTSSLRVYQFHHLGRRFVYKSLFKLKTY